MEKPFAITLDVGSSLANKTGSWRTERAGYVDRLPPCNHACPAGENIQQWLYQAEEGGEGYERAWRKIMEDNPFPAIMGRVCYHPCESSCNRAQLDEAVGINSVERFLGDQAIEQGWTMEAAAPPSGKRVLVVGAGPSGLSAAYHLTRLGHDVTIHEAGPMAGGMMRFGIPKYRLPREVLDAEVERILAMGVKLELNTKVTNIEQSLREGGFDAAFLAVGAHISKRAYIPAGESAHILDALSVLRSMEGQERPMLGRRVVVYGGGNTAMDVARTARRLGAEEAIVVYRRTRERMPAHDFEVEEAEEEGVMMRWLSTIKQADEGKLVIEKMELDETGFPQPTGELEELEADSVVLALGQDTDLSLLEGIAGIDVEEGVVKVGPNMMTGHEGIFAGGDMVPDERTVTVGIGHGKKAARHIDGWLRGKPYEPRPKPEVVTFDMLNTWYYADAPRTVQPQLDPIRRQGTFDEVVRGLDESNALFEARRCLSCGNCFSCDNCYGVCPDNAVLKLAETASANV
ncbi:MAG TPA: NAD(P)-binding protein, partial [Gaiellaceae bacterium]|nr:NAD(P)-binding protein [Gaiellaceae bacterium]